jgi:hypothetical protein
VGDIIGGHRRELQRLVQEKLPVAEAFLASMPLPSQQQQQQQQPHTRPGQQPQQLELAAVLQGLEEYSRPISQAVPSRLMAIREFQWRNGFFLQQGGATRAHCEWLRRAGVTVEGGSSGSVTAVDDVSGARLL